MTFRGQRSGGDEEASDSDAGEEAGLDGQGRPEAGQAPSWHCSLSLFPTRLINSRLQSRAQCDTEAIMTTLQVFARSISDICAGIG